MLDRLVRSLVRTQIQLLAQTQSANNRLTDVASQWLGYLGRQADLPQSNTDDERIQISLAVCKSNQCSENKQCQILTNIEQKNCGATSNRAEPTYGKMSQAQKSEVYCLLASVIQAGDKNAV